MDLTTLANVVQIFLALWVIIFGSLSVKDIVSKIPRRGKNMATPRGNKIQPFFFTNIGVALALLLSLSAFLGWHFPFQSQPPTKTSVTGTQTSTSTSTSPHSLLYQADWSKGMNGWIPASSGWSVLGNGLLVSTGSGGAIVAPYQPSTPNYAVEAQIQGISSYSSFGILVRGDGGSGGYQGFINTVHGYAYVSPISYPGSYTSGQKIQFDVTTWHTYRVEAKYNQITFLVDGQQMHQVTDNNYLKAGLVGLEDGGGQIQVKSFKVFAL